MTELIEQLKRIADALEAGNKIVEASNKISEDHVALQKLWRVENLAIEARRQARDEDWVKWNKEQKQLEIEHQEDQERQTREQALQLQERFNDAMLAKYEAQLRENAAGLFAPPVRTISTMADLGEE